MNISHKLQEIINSRSITTKDLITPLVYDCIRAFCEEVNRRAEDNMIKTGKLEGSHYAAMQQLRKELGILHED